MTPGFVAPSENPMPHNAEQDSAFKGLKSPADAAEAVNWTARATLATVSTWSRPSKPPLYLDLQYEDGEF